MPIEIIVDKTRRRVTTRCKARVNEQELRKALRFLGHDAEISPGFAFVWDLSEMRTIELSHDLLAALLVKQFWPSMKAILSVHNELVKAPPSSKR